MIRMSQPELSVQRTSRLWESPVRALAIIWAVASVVIAVIGPFGSYLEMNLAERLLYWTFVIGLATVLAPAIRRICIVVLGRNRNVVLYDLLGTPMLVAVYAPPLFFVNEVVTGGQQPLTLLSTSAIVAGATLVIIVLRELFHLHTPGSVPAFVPGDSDQSGALPAIGVLEPAGGPEEAALPETSDDDVDLLNRLPETLRGNLLVISGANHRVEVRTSRGVATILMRFSDAVREVGRTPGLQVHRSHWVADDAVLALRREGGKMLVILRCGNKIPVARSQSQAAQDRWGALSA